MKTTIGGDRLGSGNKQEVSAKNYKRSTHDMSYIWRSSMASGTLVPFLHEVGLPGDTFDIDLDVEALTLPTLGPLFGSFKLQLDVFTTPIRLYQGKLHMNQLGIGMDMGAIKLPQMTLEAWNEANSVPTDNDQIEPSSIFSYLGIRGIGRDVESQENKEIWRNFNAVGMLAYWDIYKQYYANKQEGRGFVIHNDLQGEPTIRYTSYFAESKNSPFSTWELVEHQRAKTFNSTEVYIIVYDIEEPIANRDTSFIVNGIEKEVSNYYKNAERDIITYIDSRGKTVTKNVIYYTDDLKSTIGATDEVREIYGSKLSAIDITKTAPQLTEFDLKNIDEMREDILQFTKSSTAFNINMQERAPYVLAFGKAGTDTEGYIYSKQSTQEGLGIKTYQSDLFNNWISTEWIDGDNGINEVTKVSTTDDGFTIDALNLAQKVYNMLNRIAVSGGTYDDWLDAVYTHERSRGTESPVYNGSLIKEIAFQEVISTAGGEDPLGTLAGRGKLTGKHKGGKVKIKIEEPSIIMGIVSITPRIDYSQGNKWDTRLETMNDFHKPALDAIGYQDLITDQMAWFDTEITEGIPLYKSAGKQPAWINYMTNVNQIKGNFAVESKDMFMVNSRRYESGENGIEDLTTYVDPTKFNHIFSEVQLDAQNFWIQINNNITARRKMSAKVIPNL